MYLENKLKELVISCYGAFLSHNYDSCGKKDNVINKFKRAVKFF